MLGFAHGSARAELIGGLVSVIEFGLPLAVVPGTVGYAVGIAVRPVARRAAARRAMNRYPPTTDHAATERTMPPMMCVRRYRGFRLVYGICDDPRANGSGLYQNR